MSAYYPEELLEEIRLNNDIVDVVSEYVRLERRGKYYFGICPFHKEKTASFTVTPGRQIFNCFGCGRGGNVFHFIMGIENLDFIDSVKFLADRARIELPEDGGRQERDKARLKKKLYEINKAAARYFYENLQSPVGYDARKYLERRNIDNSAIRKFGLGFSDTSGHSLLDHLKSQGFSEEEIVKSGLVIKERGGLHDRFKARIMFPIIDVVGNIIGFGGRVIDSSKPKYMNSPETLIYNKRKSLYGLNFAKNTPDRRAVVVEGYMDVISLHRRGIIGSVASLGTSLTENQGRLLKKYFDKVIIAYDADAAGMKAAMKGLDLLDRIGCDVSVLRIPGGMDPDDYINRHGADKFRDLLEKALPLVEYKIEVYREMYDDGTTEGRIRFVNTMAEVLSGIDNNVEVELYIKKIANEYGLTRDSLYAEVIKKRKSGNKKIRIAAKFAENGKDSIRDGYAGSKNLLHDEMMLIAVLLVDNSVYEYVKGILSVNDFTCETVKRVAETIFEKLEKKNRVVPAEVLNAQDKGRRYWRQL